MAVWAEIEPARLLERFHNYRAEITSVNAVFLEGKPRERHSHRIYRIVKRCCRAAAFLCRNSLGCSFHFMS